MKFSTMIVAAFFAVGLTAAPAVNMRATAYARQGKTATGSRTRRGVVAADPRILPLGSQVKITGAGPYDGHYLVEDTGVRGHRIDLFVPSRREARKFGVRPVKVKVVKRTRRRR